MSFEDLNLSEPIRRALKTAGYKKPTPIQAQAIPPALLGKDLLACAQTGTGKTAAFALPILQLLTDTTNKDQRYRPIRALVIAPTRELAIQIGESMNTYGAHTRLRHLVIYGGVSQNPQTQRLRQGVDVLVATPGRLLDLMNQGYVHLDKIEFFVLDEADNMLDMGFIHDIRRIIKKLPDQRQTFFFSATMPDEIVKLASGILTNPVRVQVDPVSSAAERVQQSVYFVSKNQKRSLLIHLLKDEEITEALIFSRTKHNANRLAKALSQKGISAEAIHGNKSQGARQQALKNFKKRNTRVLVATDIAARGIDIDQLSHVINYDLPNVAETYVHRIGRTGRAGSSGVALSFCDQEERSYLRSIQKLTGVSIPVVETHPYTGEEELFTQSAPRANTNRPDKNNFKSRRKNNNRNFRAGN